MSKKKIRNKQWEAEYETRRKMLWQKRHDLMKKIVFEYYSDGKIILKFFHAQNSWNMCLQWQISLNYQGVLVFVL